MNWDLPKQEDKVDIVSVRKMKCNHSPTGMDSTVKLDGDTDRFYCLKCWKDLGDIQDYNNFDGMGPEDF